MKVTVTGATGYLGQFIVEQFLDRSYDVHATATCLDQTSLCTDRPGLYWHEWRLADSSCSFDFLESTQVLVHSAFKHVAGKYRGGEGGDPSEFLRTNLLGTIDLFRKAREYGVQRTIFLSSRAVFGESAPETVVLPLQDEETPFPDSMYGIYKSTVEYLSEEFTDIGLCSIRPTGVYGLVHPIHRTKWIDWCRGDLSNELSLAVDRARTEVHGEEVAAAIHLLATKPDDLVIGRKFNCSDVAISESQIKFIIRALRSGNDDRFIKSNLPRCIAPHHEMVSIGLENLGWQKAGLARVIKTIRELLVVING